ncbi:MAG: AAA family ATPase [Ferruginibacter sp.]
MLDLSIKVRDYKCFGEKEQGFDKIYPVNIIIGKNNSGKSSLLDVIEEIVKSKTDFFKKKRKKTVGSQIVIKTKIDEESIKRIFPSGKHGGGINEDHRQFGLKLIDKEITYSYTENTERKIEVFNPPLHTTYDSDLVSVLKNPLQNRTFIKINGERDIKSEGIHRSQIELSPDGSGATDFIRRIVTMSAYDTSLITKILLSELNKILSPDLEFKNILPQEIEGEGKWEIFFEDTDENVIEISRMGNGIKSILLVLLNMVVWPEINKIKRDTIVFAFEELENNLHPALQRRLFNYIESYSLKYKSTFFITSHSSIVVDMFSRNLNAQILHVTKQADTAIVKTVIDHQDGKNILKDLDYKASDLLLSNGIIWVEGPSDAIYIELILELFCKQKKLPPFKNMSFTIQSLSTAIWKYAGFEDFNWDKVNIEIENKIISLQKLNQNHLLLIDKDGNYENLKPSQYDKFKDGTGKNKARLIFESIKYMNIDETSLENNYGNLKENKLAFWINEGTFETYLGFFLKNKGEANYSKFFKKNKKLGYLEKKRTGEFSSISKVELAANISSFCLANCNLADLAPLDSDLYDKTQRLYNTIKNGWN